MIVLIDVVIKMLEYEKKCKKISTLIEDDLKILNTLNTLHKNQEIINLKKTIELYSQFQILLKISKCDYISLFKYDYTKKFVILHFLLSVDEKGVILQDSKLEDLPVASSVITLNIMRSDNDNLYSLLVDEVKEKDITIYNIMLKRGINKIYYQNIYKDEFNPLGYVAISYKNINYELPEEDKIEILRIIEKIKSYL
jgi:hypothetical protein